MMVCLELRQSSETPERITIKAAIIGLISMKCSKLMNLSEGNKYRAITKFVHSRGAPLWSPWGLRSALSSLYSRGAPLRSPSDADFGIKGTLATLCSRAVFGFEIPKQACGCNSRNFTFAAPGYTSRLRFSGCRRVASLAPATSRKWGDRAAASAPAWPRSMPPASAAAW